MSKTRDLMSIFITRAAKYYHKGRDMLDGLEDLHKYYCSKGKYSSEDYHSCSCISLENEEIPLWYYDDAEWIPYLQGYDREYFDIIGYHLPLFVALKRKKLNLLILDYYKLCRRANSDRAYWYGVSSLIPNAESLRKQKRIANIYVNHAKHHKETAHIEAWIFDTTNDDFLKEIESQYFSK